MKKNIIKMTIALFFVLLVVANFALASSGIKVPTIKQVQGGKAESLVGQILGILQFTAVAIALGMLLVIGIKYITASPEGKADIKGTAIAYLIGAVCIFAAVLVISASSLVAASLGIATAANIPKITITKINSIIVKPFFMVSSLKIKNLADYTTFFSKGK